MSPKSALVSRWLTRLALIVIMASSAFLMYFMSEIDRMINVQLYGYGLQFSSSWWDPYSSVVRIVYACLVAIIVLGGLSLVLGLQSTKNEDTAEQKQPVAQMQPINSASEEKCPIETYKSCPQCKRVITKPIVMLNFEGGKGKLVRVCPHCNFILGNDEAKQSDENEDGKV